MRSHAKASLLGRRRALSSISVALLLSAGLLAFASAPASAATGRAFLRSFSIGAEKEPRGIAADGAGDLYVYELGGGQGQALEKLDPQGNPVDFSASASYISGNKLTGTPSESFNTEPFVTAQVAVDDSGGPADGYIYVATATAQGGGIYVYAPSGEYKGFLRSQPNGLLACGIGIDQSTGDVYLTQFSSEFVTRFSPVDGDPSHDSTGQLKLGPQMGAVAVDSTGTAYVSGLRFEHGSQFGGVTKYSAAQASAEAPVGEAIDPNAAASIVIDPSNDNVLLDLGNRIVERAPSGALAGEFGASSASTGAAVSGSEVFAVDESGTVSVYGSPQQLPKVETGEAENVARDSAEVEGEVDPDGTGEVTGCEFRFGTDGSYSSGSVPCTPAAPIAATAGVGANLTGLQAGTTYHYRLVVENSNGVQAGADRTFTTPPAVASVTTGEATAVSKDSATVAGSYVGEGLDAHYYFEYGTTQGYGNSTPAPPGNDAGSASGEQSVNPVTLTGLKGATTYHYRLVASNSYGETRGGDMTFTTAPSITGLTTDPASGVTNEAADLNGSFDADSYDVHYYFEWGSSTSYGNTAPAAPGEDAGTGSGRQAVAPVHIGGLEAGATYHLRIVASSENGKTIGPDQTFRTAERPSVANLSTADVTADSAELLAEVNPNQGETRYRFEWGPSTTYGSSIPIPEGDAGAGSASVRVSAQLEGLSPGTAYHFRVVATNPYGTSVSGDQSFGFYPAACPNAQVRQETGSNDLPDCRAYELTTPSSAGGAVIFPLNGPNTGLATNPSRVAYGANIGTLPDSGDPMNSVADLYVSTRTDSGWRTRYIGRPANEALLMGGPPEGEIGSIFQGQSAATSMIGSAASPNMDRFANYDLGNPSGVYGQLGEPSNAPFVWDASTGAQIERWPTNLDSVPGGRNFVGTPKVSADFNHFVFSSNVAFAPGGEEFEAKIGCCEEHRVFEGMCCSAPVYDNSISTGQVALVSIKEDGTPFRGAPVHVSDDGSRILMSETNDVASGANRPLFLRADDSRSYDIAGGKPVHYVGSTADGEIVYLTSAEQLTADDHDSSVDLFAWKESEPHSLTRISVGTTGAGNSDECAVSWASGCGIGLISLNRYFGAPGGTSGQETGNGTSDGPIASGSGDIYFESPEQLVGAKGEPGQVNLYLYRDGSVRYVTTMTTQVTCGDENTLAEICSEGPVARMQVTPSGAHMAFVTASRLTSYDNNGRGEMYSYSPTTSDVICVSCRTDGQPAQSTAYGSQNGLFLTNDGRVFFSTKDALVPHDTNEINDVYEYAEGKPQLISAGIGVSTEGFAGGFNGVTTTPGLVSVSANGTDVYFATYDSLVTQDHNGQQLKIYDARTGGGFPAEQDLPGCAAADECHGAGSARPPAALDRTSADLGRTAKQRKHRKHVKRKHPKHRKHKAKKRAKQAHKSQGGHDRG